MRVGRPLVLAVLIVGAFFYFTTYRNGRLQPSNWTRPSGVEITEAAGGGSDPLDPEEQNNINV